MSAALAKLSWSASLAGLTLGLAARAMAISMPPAPTTEPASAISIVSDSACPSAEWVQAALLPLLPSPPTDQVIVRLHDDGASLDLTFSWAGQSRSDSRTLVLGPDCRSRAAQVAVVVASWLVVPRVEALPAPVFATRVRGPAQRGPDLPSRDLALRQTTVGIGLLALSRAGWASGLRVEVAVAPVESGFGWGASVVAMKPLDVALDAGVSRWSLASLSAVFKARRKGAWFDGEAEAGPMAGLAIGWGDGYPVNRTDAAWFWGLEGGLRLLAHGRPFQPWIDVRATGWPWPPRLRIDSTTGDNPILARLPSTDVQIAVGMNVMIP